MNLNWTLFLTGVVIALAVLIGILLIYLRIWRHKIKKPDLHVDQQRNTSDEPVPGDLQDKENLQGRYSSNPNQDATEPNLNPEKDRLLILSNSQDGSERIRFNLSTELTAKVLNLQSTSKREVNQDRFTVGNKIGSGNFGNVYGGVLKGLYNDVSATTVAIKSINGDRLSETELDNMISEIKIMSNTPPHINIASMIASCSSQFIDNGKLWLILEFCQHGDLKQFLTANKAAILSGTNTNVINSRCLAIWTYEIASGMSFLASNKIMHGDLAARNILMADNPLEAKPPVAKVADFGLSKSFNDYIIYEKKERNFVPWRWMALEYLNDGYFTLKSDVWSFGVLLWEIFSFGKTPYGHQGYDEVLEILQSGYQLPCPKETQSITSWAAGRVYDKWSKLCLVPNPGLRATFSDLLIMVKNELNEEEKLTQEKMSASYLSSNTAEYLKIKRL